MHRALAICIGLALLSAACGSDPGAPASAAAAPPDVAPPMDAGHGEAAEQPSPAVSYSFDPLAGCTNVAADAAAFDLFGDRGALGKSNGPTPSLLPALGLTRAAGDGAPALFLIKASPFASLPVTPAAPFDGDYVLRARVHAPRADVALLAHADARGSAYALRRGPAGAEIVQLRGFDAIALAAEKAGDAGAHAELSFALSVKVIAGKVELAGKIWAAEAAEPAAWQVRWTYAPSSNPRITNEVAPGRIGLAIAPSDGAPSEAALEYLTVGYATAEGIASKDLHPFAACTQKFPAAPPAADGAHDAAGNAANQAQTKALLAWGLRPPGAPSVARLVAMSAGTGNDLGQASNLTACTTAAKSSKRAWIDAVLGKYPAAKRDGAKCIVSGYQAFDIAYGALRTAGYTDAEIADPAKFQFALWGFGDATRGAFNWYHPAGTEDASFAIPIWGLGGENAGLHGPDAAPKTGAIPLVSTFAYTYPHATGDGAAFRDALNDLVSRDFPALPGGSAVPIAKDHVFVVSHSWGAAYTTTMLLRDYPHAMPDLHVDFALTAALPKLAADLDSLLSCAVDIAKGGGLEACLDGKDALSAKLDIPAGLHFGPGFVPLYRVDRPDDPVANARDIKTAFTLLNGAVSGNVSGHDYVMRAPGASVDACTQKGTGKAFRYLSGGGATAYAGIYGVAAFAVTCSVGGAVLDYRCDDVVRAGNVWCKQFSGGTKDPVCTAKPAECQ